MANISRKALREAKRAVARSGALPVRNTVKEARESYVKNTQHSPRVSFGFSEGSLIELRRSSRARVDGDTWRWEKLPAGTMGLVVKGPYQESSSNDSWKADILVGSNLYKDVEAGKLVIVCDEE